MSAPIWRPSPNFADGREGVAIDAIVLHNTAGALHGALTTLTSAAARVSAHYLVDRTGETYQLVREEDTAWHAGVRWWNQRSVGIEIVAHEHAKGFGPAQEFAVVDLCRALMARHGISAANVMPHRQVRPTACPGFVWPSDVDFRAWVARHLGREERS